MKSHIARRFCLFMWPVILNILFIVSCNPTSFSTVKPPLLVSDTPSIQPTLTLSSTLIKTPATAHSPSPDVSSTGTSLLTPKSTGKSTPTSNAPTATFVKNANCRSGPGTNYGGVTTFLTGQVVQIVGRYLNFDNGWWYVRVPNTDDKCWVSQVTVIASGNLDEIPIIKITPIPTSNYKKTPIAPPPVEETHIPAP